MIDIPETELPHMNPAQADAYRRAVAHAHTHDIVCSGAPHSSTPCEHPAVLVIILHGRGYAVTCPICTDAVVKLIMAMGHGAVMVSGIIVQNNDGSYEYDPAELHTFSHVQRARHSQPDGWTLRRGRDWTQQRENAYRRSIPQ